ncbi:MAG: O-antigen ligase family protein [Desulfobaccales bacterium]
MTRSEKIIWLFFAATSCQLVLQHPSFLLVAGERSNLFSGLLCFLTLLVAVVFGRRDAIQVRSPEFLISAALAVIAGVSAGFSITPLSSSFRVFVFLASGLGGFWCARILLQTPENQRRFVRLCLWLLGALLVLSFLGYFTTAYIEHFMIDRSHPLTNLILLLCFAPLTLLGQKSRPLMVLGIVLLGLSYIILCLSERISVVFIPLGVCLVGTLFGTLRWKYFLLICLVMAMVVGMFHQKIIWHKLSMAYPAYRMENFPFSWSIAKKYPWLGIGLRAPREQFIRDYTPIYPTVTKEQFSRTIREIVSADNQFLTLMVGLGLPFTLIYLASLGILLARLGGLAFKPPPGGVLHPLVLLFSLTMALVHFQFFDGLLFPQCCWFFHLLLGLIPLRGVSPETAAQQVRDDLSYVAKSPIG